jgi:hypothetical protein
MSGLTYYDKEMYAVRSSVNHSYAMSRLTCYDEEDVVRSGVNDSYAISRLTS